MEVKPGYKQTEVGVIPQDWRVVSIGSIAAVGRGRVISHRDIARARNPQYPIYSSQTSNDGVMGYIDTFDFEGEYVTWTTDGENAGTVFARNGRFNCTNVCGTIKLRSDNHIFVARSLSRFAPQHVSRHVGNPKLMNDIMKRVQIPLPPSRGEQDAIAEALSDVDALLCALDRLIAKKRDLKQAAMQQLLTGQTRLPGFSGEWDEFLVEDVIVRSFCGPSPTCEERNIGDQFEWGVLKTTAATVDAGWNWRAHKVLPQAFWHQDEIELCKGDVIVTKAGPRHRVGVAVWIDFVPPRIIPSGKMIALRPDPKRAVPLLLASAISAPAAQTFLDQRTTGMAESQVNYENGVLLKAPIRLPDIEEQAAIAAVLSDMDAELEALEQRRAKTAALKQGMMQELLTGRTRLV